MSGTSLDGLDLVYCTIWKKLNQWQFEINATKSVDYDAAMTAQLKHAITLPSEELLQLHNSYGQWLGEQVSYFVEEQQLEVDLIASHGHTVHHQPDKGITLQIGSGQHLANNCKKKVVCDFRTNDVALGGQGAPLVPIGDQLFFGSHDFCLNLGGISNVSFDHQGTRKAYDIGLANMILNHISSKINLKFDAGGAMASRGKLNTKMLEQLNALDYYRLDFPKSTGYEWFTEKVIPIVDATEDTIENLLHTSIHHICEQIAIQITKNSSRNNATLWITGGGALNHFLIDMLQKKLGTVALVTLPSPTLIAFKEALVFALMGVLRIEQETNVLASVTGATSDSSSGVVYLPL